MIVCVCVNVNDKKIKKAIAKGHDTHGKLKKYLGVCRQCCKCKTHIKEEIEKWQSRVL